MKKLTLIALLSASAVVVANNQPAAQNAPAAAKTAADVKKSAERLQDNADQIKQATEDQTKWSAEHNALVDEVEKTPFYARGYRAVKNVAVETKDVMFAHKMSFAIAMALGAAICKGAEYLYNYVTSEAKPEEAKKKPLAEMTAEERKAQVAYDAAVAQAVDARQQAVNKTAKKN